MTQQTPPPEPQLTWEQIFDLPVEDPAIAQALDTFLEEIAEAARSLPPDEPAANTDE